MKHKLLTFLILPVIFWGCKEKPKEPLPELSLRGFRDGIHHWNLEHPERTYRRYEPQQVRGIAANILALQNPDGGWPKNIDIQAILNTDSLKATLTGRKGESTLDNDNVFPQIEYLAEVYNLTEEEPYRQAAERGIRYILDTQYERGGWRGWDADAITYNDDVTTNAMELMYRVGNYDIPYTWISQEIAQAAKEAFRRALDVTLRCQIEINGVKTAWCQQHDPQTLEPVGARAYELPGITAHESAAIVLFLMSLPDPEEPVIQAVQSAVAWFRKSALKGIRIEKIEIDPDSITHPEYPYDLVVVRDREAEPIWARFYELSDGRTPFMANRDGNKVYHLSEVLPERRVGYSWYGTWPKRVLNLYPKWLERNGIK